MKNILIALSLILLSNITHAQWSYRYLTDGSHQVGISLMLNKDTGITITNFVSNPDKYPPVITFNGFNTYSHFPALDTSLSFGRDIIKIEENGFMLVTQDSFYLSNDYGQSFITKPNRLDAYGYEWHNGVLFTGGTEPISNRSGLLSSIDTGQTWTVVSDTLDKYYIFSDQVIWIMRELKNGDFDYKTELWRTTNGGTNWQHMHTSYNSIIRTFENCFFLTKNIGYWTKETNDSLFKTMDGGITWNYQGPLPLSFFYLYFINEQVGFGGRNSIHKTVDGGKTWTPQSGGIIRYFHCIDSMQCFAYSNEPGAIYYTANQGGGPFTSVQESNKVQSPLVLFPNPANNSITIQLSTITTQTSIDIYDIMGKLVLHKNTITQITELDISTLKTGMYMVTINGDGVKESKKLLVE